MREQRAVLIISTPFVLFVGRCSLRTSTTKNLLVAANAEERKANGIENLPSTLQEATREFEKSEFVKDVLGEHIFSKYLAGKKQEWESYTTRITQWEIEEYLTKY